MVLRLIEHQQPSRVVTRLLSLSARLVGSRAGGGLTTHKTVDLAQQPPPDARESRPVVVSATTAVGRGSTFTNLTTVAGTEAA